MDAHARLADMAAFVYAFLVAAPIEQGLKVAAVTPAFRSPYFETPTDGIIYAAAAALGFVTAHDLAFLAGEGATPLNALRAALGAPAHVLIASAWGYALGREKRRAARGTQFTSTARRLGGRAFNAVWLAAMLLNAVYDHLTFARTGAALAAAATLLLLMGAGGYLASRDVWKRAPAGGPVTRRRRFLRTIAPPSIREVRAALSRSEQPLMMRWIAYGALVQVGVITACNGAAVALGHRLGVDFAAVDRGGGEGSIAPLFLLGCATLAAFPVAGYLIARASATTTVLEPAIAAALAILGAMVLLGLAAPITVLFALAFAPVAFGLACAGAWVGVSR